MFCSICGGPKGVLGVLGNLVHCVCRDCGMQSSIKVDDLDDDVREELFPTENDDVDE